MLLRLVHVIDVQVLGREVQQLAHLHLVGQVQLQHVLAIGQRSQFIQTLGRRRFGGGLRSDIVHNLRPILSRPGIRLGRQARCDNRGLDRRGFRRFDAFGGWICFETLRLVGRIRDDGWRLRQCRVRRLVVVPNCRRRAACPPDTALSGASWDSIALDCSVICREPSAPNSTKASRSFWMRAGMIATTDGPWISMIVRVRSPCCGGLAGSDGDVAQCGSGPAVCRHDPCARRGGQDLDEEILPRVHQVH